MFALDVICRKKTKPLNRVVLEIAGQTILSVSFLVALQLGLIGIYTSFCYAATGNNAHEKKHHG